MIAPTVKAGDGSSGEYLGKSASDLQDNIVITGRDITGTLKQITFEEFSNNPEETTGHYLVLSLTAPEKVTIKTKIGDSGVEKEVSDGYCIYRVKDKDKQKIYVITEKDGDSYRQIYNLSGLTLSDV